MDAFQAAIITGSLPAFVLGDLSLFQPKQRYYEKK
jgi:hypothetical protein